jgi:hypothetical protein
MEGAFNLTGMLSVSWPSSHNSLKFAYAMQILGYALTCQLLERADSEGIT